MAKVLVVTNGLTGMGIASGEMCRRLAAAGYRVHFASPEPPVAGLERVLAGNHLLLPLQLRPAPPLPSVPAPLRWINGLIRYPARRRAALANLGQEQFEQLLERLQPDLVLLDVELHAFIFNTHRLGYRYALISQWFQTGNFPGLPPAETQLLPGQTEAIRLARAAKAERERRRRTRMARRDAYNDRFSVQAAYAKQCAFPERLLTHDGWPPPFGYRDVPTLHFTDRELDFPYPVPSTSHYVGPMVREAAWEERLPEDLRDLLAHARRQNQAVLYLTGSSMRGQTATYLQRMVHAVAGRPEWTLLVSLGGNRADPDLPRPANVHYFDWLPQRALLPEVDLCINHAGINTLHECLYCGTPMLVYSGGRHDQPGCAARMQYYKLAVVGDPEARPGQLQADIQRALDDRESAGNREAVRRRMHAPESRAVLLRTVEQLLGP